MEAAAHGSVGSASLLEHFYQVERATVISTETQLEIDRKAFTVYRVEVVPIGGLPWIVAKRFSEFSDLRAALGAIDKKGKRQLDKHPFPPKHMYGSMQAEVVTARMETLQVWLAEVLREYRNAVPLLNFLADDGSENSAVDLLGAKSYLRGVDLILEKPLTAWGSRTPKEKSCYLLSRKKGSLAAVGPKRQVLAMLTLSSPPLGGACPVALASESNRRHLRSFLMDLDHPFLMPVVEVGVQVENEKALIFREFAARGSLKDAVYKAKSPCARAVEKYEGKAAGKRAGLNETKVALFGRQVRARLRFDFTQRLRPGSAVAQIDRRMVYVWLQVLEGMRYLEELGLDCSFVNTGNVLLCENDWCRIADFENPVLGVAPRQSKGLRKFLEGGASPREGGKAEAGAAAGSAGEGDESAGVPATLAFGVLLYELATGMELKYEGDAFKMPACPMQIQRILDMIFNEGAEPHDVMGAARGAGGMGSGESIEGTSSPA